MKIEPEVCYDDARPARVQWQGCMMVPLGHHAPTHSFMPLNAMHGLSLLFLLWPFIANTTTLLFSVHKLEQVTTTPQVLKVPILSKL